MKTALSYRMFVPETWYIYLLRIVVSRYTNHNKISILRNSAHMRIFNLVSFRLIIADTVIYYCELQHF